MSNGKGQSSGTPKGEPDLRNLRADFTRWSRDALGDSEESSALATLTGGSGEPLAGRLPDPGVARQRGLLEARFGRAFSLAVSKAWFLEHLPHAVAPAFIFWLRVFVDCVEPTEFDLGGAVEAENGAAGDMPLEGLVGMSPHVVRVGRRAESDLYAAAWDAAVSYAERAMGARVREWQSRLVTLRSRKLREIEAVFAERFAEAEGAEANESAPDTWRAVENDKREAQRMVERHFDPERIGVTVRPQLVLYLTVAARRRKGGAKHA